MKDQFQVADHLVKRVYQEMFGDTNDVEFFNLASLNVELYLYLKRHGYDSVDILSKRPVNTRKKVLSSIPTELFDRVMRAEV